MEDNDAAAGGSVIFCQQAPRREDNSASPPPSSLPLGISLAQLGVESRGQQSWEGNLVGDKTQWKVMHGAPCPSLTLMPVSQMRKLSLTRITKGKGQRWDLFPGHPPLYPCLLSLVILGTMTHSDPCCLQPDMASRAF